METHLLAGWGQPGWENAIENSSRSQLVFSGPASGRMDKFLPTHDEFVLI